jgi:hypothetical protein
MARYKSENMERLRALSQDLQVPVDSFCVKKICDTVEKISSMLEQPRINKKAIKAELDSLVAEIKNKTVI